MIFKSAIKSYLSRPLRDLGEVKTWSDAKLDRKLAELVPRPVFITEPRRHQKVCFYLHAKLPFLLDFQDMGLGKSKLVLDLFRWYKSSGKLHRLLICVPNVCNLESWRDEIAKHAPDLTASYVEGTSETRKRNFTAKTDLCITTYAGLNHIICAKTTVKKRGDTFDTKNVLRPVKSTIISVSETFDGVVWDESTALKNKDSLTFKVADKISRNWRFRVGLTGTPLGRNPTDLWSQFFAVDRGDTLGTTFGLYEQAFFNLSYNPFGGKDRKFKSRLASTLSSMISHGAIRYTAQECLDLPKRIPVHFPVALLEEGWAYYEAVINQIREQELGVLDIKNSFLRLRQITSGFVSVNGSPSPLQSNPKLDAFVELVSELDQSEKVVCFHEYIYSGNQLSQSLVKLKIDHSRIYGETKDKQGELRRFLSDPKCRVLVVNNRSGALGLNLQVARYVVFYESPVSPIVRQQAEARCLRQGQTRPVFIYDLACRKTVDEKILFYLAEGKDLAESILSGGKNILFG